MGKQYDKQFKQNAVAYRFDHPDLTIKECVAKLGVPYDTYTRTTINPDFSSSLKNILSQQFNPEKPDAAWCSDITYIPTDEGFVYLTSIMDLYSRKIVSWTLSTTLEAVHVADTVHKAMKLRKVSSPLVLHSDRGSQYVSDAYLEAAQKAQLSYHACLRCHHCCSSVKNPAKLNRPNRIN